eukprot:gene1942-33353_t
MSGDKKVLSRSSLQLTDLASPCRLVASSNRNVTARAAPPTAPPTPIVKIDNMSDSIVSLKNIGLNIRRAKIAQPGQGKACTRFFITEAETSEKITKSARLEEIRLTVLHSLESTFPELNGRSLASAPSYAEIKALGPRKLVPTTVEVTEAPNGSCSLLKIVTEDRPGLLIDIVHVLKDINLNVVSAEVDTIGSQAVDIFFLTYHGEPLSSSMITLTTNSLQYYLSLNEMAREESY